MTPAAFLCSLAACMCPVGACLCTRGASGRNEDAQRASNAGLERRAGQSQSALRVGDRRSTFRRLRMRCPIANRKMGGTHRLRYIAGDACHSRKRRGRYEQEDSDTLTASTRSKRGKWPDLREQLLSGSPGPPIRYVGFTCSPLMTSGALGSVATKAGSSSEFS